MKTTTAPALPNGWQRSRARTQASNQSVATPWRSLTHRGSKYEAASRISSGRQCCHPSTSTWIALVAPSALPNRWPKATEAMAMRNFSCQLKRLNTSMKNSQVPGDSRHVASCCSSETSTRHLPAHKSTPTRWTPDNTPPLGFWPSPRWCKDGGIRQPKASRTAGRWSSPCSRLATHAARSSRATSPRA